MTAVAVVVSRSLRLLRVQDPGQAVEAQDFETACVALNAMMARWEANGLALGWSPVNTPDQELPAPPEAEEAIAYSLAIQLADEYGVAISPVIAAIAAQSLSGLRIDVKMANPMGWDRCRGGYDTRTDYFY